MDSHLGTRESWKPETDMDGKNDLKSAKSWPRQHTCPRSYKTSHMEIFEHFMANKGRKRIQKSNTAQHCGAAVNPEPTLFRWKSLVVGGRTRGPLGTGKAIGIKVWKCVPYT